MYANIVTLFQAISGFKNPSGLDGIDIIFKLKNLDELEDVSNRNLFILVWLIFLKVFSGIAIWRCWSNYMYFDLEGPFLQSAFRPYYLGCGFNKFCFENSLGGEVNPYLHSDIIVGVLYHVLIIYLIICILEGSLESHQSSLTIFSHTWCNIKAGPCFCFVAWCVDIATNGWCAKNSLWNWLRTLAIGGWSSPGKHGKSALG